MQYAHILVHFGQEIDLILAVPEDNLHMYPQVLYQVVSFCHRLLYVSSLFKMSFAINCLADIPRVMQI